MDYIDIEIIEEQVQYLQEKQYLGINFFNEFSPMFHKYKNLQEFFDTGIMDESDFHDIKNEIMYSLLSEEITSDEKIKKEKEKQKEISEKIKDEKTKSKNRAVASFQTNAGTTQAAYGLMGNKIANTVNLSNVRSQAQNQTQTQISKVANTSQGKFLSQKLPSWAKMGLSASALTVSGIAQRGQVSQILSRSMDSITKKYSQCAYKCKNTKSSAVLFSFKGEDYSMCMLECQISVEKERLALMKKNYQEIMKIPDENKRNKSIQIYNKKVESIKNNIQQKQKVLDEKIKNKNIK